MQLIVLLYFCCRNNTRTAIILIGIWTVSFLTLFPIALISQLVELWDFGTYQYFCVEHWAVEGQRQAYTIIVFSTSYLMPLVAIAVAYFLMARSLWRSVRPGCSVNDNTVKAVRGRRKIAKMVFVIVVIFGISWLPIHVVHLRNDLTSQGFSNAFYILKIIGHCMSYANSAINPVIYSFMSQNFKKCFKQAFSFRSCRKNRSRDIFVLTDPENPDQNQNRNQNRYQNLHQRNTNGRRNQPIQANPLPMVVKMNTRGSSQTALCDSPAIQSTRM